MKKGIKIILIILGIWLSLFLVDFICIKTIKRPIFMIRTVIYKDGGTKEYLGLGYKVIKCNTLTDDDRCFVCRDDGRDDKVLCVVEDTKNVFLCSPDFYPCYTFKGWSLESGLSCIFQAIGNILDL